MGMLPGCSKPCRIYRREGGNFEPAKLHGIGDRPFHANRTARCILRLRSPVCFNFRFSCGPPQSKYQIGRLSQELLIEFGRPMATNDPKQWHQP